MSTQDREWTLAEAARVLDPGGLLHIDVSGNFDTREPAEWHVVLHAPYRAAGMAVREWERQVPMFDHLLIERSFRADDGSVLVEVQERWAYLGSLDLMSALDRAGFDVIGVDRGYGHGYSPHRIVHHARRRA